MISIGSPTDRGVLSQGQRIAATYGCADEANGSGVATCTGPVASGAAIDAATPGRKTFATDKAGKTTTKFTALAVKGIPTGATVAATCTGKSCPAHKVKGKRRARSLTQQKRQPA